MSFEGHSGVIIKSLKVIWWLFVVHGSQKTSVYEWPSTSCPKAISKFGWTGCYSHIVIVNDGHYFHIVIVKDCCLL